MEASWEEKTGQRKQFCQTSGMPSLSTQLHTRSDLTIVLTRQLFDQQPILISDQQKQQIQKKSCYITL